MKYIRNIIYTAIFFTVVCIVISATTGQACAANYPQIIKVTSVSIDVDS